MPDDLAIPKIIPREKVAPVKRKPLGKFAFAELFLSQGGKCAKCGERLKPGKTRDEHLVPISALGGNEITNRALWCLACTKPKDKTDNARAKKGRRLRGEVSTQISRRQDRGSSSIKSRGQIAKAGFREKPEGFVSTLSKDHPGYVKRNFR